MRTGCALFAMILTLALASCANRRKAAEQLLKEVRAEQLRTDAALLYKELFAGRGAGFIVVPSSSWPASFKRFAPIRVSAYLDGLSIALETQGAREAGLYVIPQGMQHAPASNANAQFSPLVDGVFWYSFAE